MIARHRIPYGILIGIFMGQPCDDFGAALLLGKFFSENPVGSSSRHWGKERNLLNVFALGVKPVNFLDDLRPELGGSASPVTSVGSSGREARALQRYTP
jgi:hypothetical protein